MSSGGSDRTPTAAAIRQVMDAEGAAVAANTQGFNAGRVASVAGLDDYEALKAEARAIKAEAIERLPELITELTATVEANGGSVYVAADAADANAHIRALVAAADAQRLVKSKSMTTEEIEVNAALAADGVEVVETDLGEWVLQLAEEAPSHIVAPAIHKSREEIAALFAATFDPTEPPETAAELTRFARERLGALIEGADVGMTGANFITADTGTLALVTSEGNARKTAVVPDTHIAVAGVEKVVPSVEELAPFIELIGRSGTGQDITSYISLLTPPVRSPVPDFDVPEQPLSTGEPDRDFHLVLIDNGRLAMREDAQLRETLYCIRCSACSNACANFQSVGGHVFGGETYSGGIATGWEAGIEGLDVAGGFNDLCTGCSRCVPACPVGIDIPWINTVVRDRRNRSADHRLEWLVDGLSPDTEPAGAPLQKRFFGNFETVARWGSATAPVSNWLAALAPTRRLMAWLLGIDPRRALPQFARETFVDWAADHHSSVDTPLRRAVVYPDLYTNHIQVARGRAAVRALEALGVDVVVPQVASSGRAPLSQGMVTTATDHAERVHAALAPHIADGRDVVVIEPSDHAMFQHEYARLLDAPAAESLASHSYELCEYIYGLFEHGADPAALTDGAATPLAYHSHCQQRTLDLEAHTVAVLERCGFDVETTAVECCGMAGSFGYKRDYYEVSMDVGGRLADQLRADGLAGRAVVASGTSCLEQIDALLTRSPAHPIELLAPGE